jgi:hypothetical protein
MRTIALFTVAAVLGLGAAVGVTLAATELTSQDIGLDSEPLTAGRDLAPAPARTTPKKPRTRTTPDRPPRTTSTPTPPPATNPAPPPPVDDHGGDDSGGDDSSGRGRGRGRGGGGDDD